MATSDKSRTKTWGRVTLRSGGLGLALLGLVSCNRMVTPPAKQTLKDADAKVASGDFLQAIGLYESALDGSATSAETHYKLALLYDDKMSDSLNALHHFKRYLMIAPTGMHANEVKNFIKRDELALVTSLSGDSVFSRGEAVHLKNDNLELRKQLEDLTLKSRTAATAKDKRGKPLENGTTAVKPRHKGGQTYVVQAGDTLFSISRKFYGSSSGWKKIRNAHGRKFSDPAKLKPGETVTIP